jgi:hypothetical protein
MPAEPRRVTPEVRETVRVSAVTSPFSIERVSVQVPEGGTVADLMRMVGLDAGVAARVFHNERLLTLEERARVTPRAGDFVAIRVVPQRGQGKNPEAMLLQLAVMAAAAAATIVTAGAAAPFLGPAVSMGAGTVAGAAVTMAGNLIIRALVGPPTPPGPAVSASPRRFSISGGQNVAAPFAAIPKVYGSRLVTPQLAAGPYTETSGPDQFLRMLLMIGYGPIDITQIQIGNTPIQGFEDIEWEVRAGYPDDAPPRLYPGSVVEDVFNVALAISRTQAAPLWEGWQQRTSGTGADELSVDITCPSGLIEIKPDGTKAWAQVHVQIRYAPAGTTAWIYEPSADGFHIKGEQASVLRRGHIWRVPNGQYDVQVQVVGGWTSDGSWAGSYAVDTYWTALRTIRAQAPFAKNGLAMIGMRIRASHQLNGVITNLNCTASSILPDYNPATGRWDDRAGSWFYDYDNQGNGASNYALDALTPHTTGAQTDSRWITDEVLGIGDGTTVGFSGTLAHTPIVPGSLVISIGSQASATSAPRTRKTGGQAAILAFISDDGQGNITGPSVSSGTIDYQGGAWSITFTVAPANDLGSITADYQIRVITAGAGRALAITTAAATDGAAVASKSIPVHILAPDINGNVPSTTYHVSAWFKASQTITQGVRIRFLTGSAEDFAVGAATHSMDVTANGSAGASANTTWQQVTADITWQADGYWMRIVCEHVPDLVGGVTVEFDDVSAVRTAPDQGGVNVVPNGSFDTAGAITSNPAAHLRDLMQGRATSPPARVPDSRIDLAALAGWWLECQAEARFMNAIFDRQMTHFQAYRQIAGFGRAAWGMVNGLYSVIRDQPQGAPVQHLTPRNSFGFKGSKMFPILPHALHVRYVNTGNEWKPDEVPVYDDGYGPANATIWESLDLSDGCTDPVMAWKLGRYHLAQARLRPETYELSADIESLVATRGDLVYVSHDVLQVGLGWGRVKQVNLDSAGSCLGVTLDESGPQMSMTGGTSYALRIRRGDGTSLLLDLVNPVPAGQTDASGAFTFATAIPSGHAQPEVGDLAMFGLQGAETGEYLVTKVEPQKNLTAILTLVDYAPAVYQADASPPYYTPQTTALPVPLAPTIVSYRSDDLAAATAPDGSSTGEIIVTLATPSGTQPDFGPIEGVEAQYRKSATDGTVDRGAWSSVTAYAIGDTVTYNSQSWLAVAASTNVAPGSDATAWTLLVNHNDWQSAPQAPPKHDPLGTVTITPVEPGHQYDFRVRYDYGTPAIIGGKHPAPANIWNFSAWAEVDGYTVQGQVTLPDEVTNLTATDRRIGVVELSWTKPQAKNIREYEIRQGASWAAGTLVAQLRATHYKLTRLAPATYTWWVGTIDTSGNYGSSPPSVTLAVATDQVVTADIAYGSVTNSVKDEETGSTTLTRNSYIICAQVLFQANSSNDEIRVSGILKLSLSNFSTASDELDAEVLLDAASSSPGSVPSGGTVLISFPIKPSVTSGPQSNPTLAAPLPTHTFVPGDANFHSLTLAIKLNTGGSTLTGSCTYALLEALDLMA